MSGGTPSRSHIEYWDKGSIPWIKIGNIKGKYVSTSDEYITQAGLDGSSAKMLPKGTLLYTIFATLGEVGILTIEACTNQAIAGISIKHNDEISTDFLYYYLKSKKSYVNKIGRGVAQNNINMSMLRALEVPVPNIAEQSRIVSVLDSVASVVTIRQQQLEKLDELVKARFVELFGDPILNQKQFPVYRMDEVVEFQGGSQPDKKFFEYEPTDDNIRLIQIRDYKTDKFITYIPRAMAKRFCTADDIMIGRYGPPIFQILQGIEGSFNVALMKATPKKGNKEFVRQFLKQECLLDYLEGMSKRTAGQDGIQMDKLKAYPFPLPPVELQNQFEKFANQVDKSKVAVQKSLDEAQLLFDSLMQQYFG